MTSGEMTAISKCSSDKLLSAAVKRKLSQPNEVDSNGLLRSWLLWCSKKEPNAVKALIGDIVNTNSAEAAAFFMRWLKLTNVYIPKCNSTPVHSRYHTDYQEEFQRVEQALGYSFNNKALLVQAFTRLDVPTQGLTELQFNRLEFIGDALLEYLTCKHLVGELELQADQLPRSYLKRRCWSLAKNLLFASVLVNRKLDRVQRCGGELSDRMQDWVASNGSIIARVLQDPSRVKNEQAPGFPKELADPFEALIGAVFIDSGHSLEKVWQVAYRLLQAQIDQSGGIGTL